MRWRGEGGVFGRDRIQGGGTRALQQRGAAHQEARSLVLEEAQPRCVGGEEDQHGEGRGVVLEADVGDEGGLVNACALELLCVSGFVEEPAPPYQNTVSHGC